MSPPVASPLYGVLLLCLPGVWLLGYRLALSVTPGRLAPWMAPALGVAQWLLLVHLTGKLTHSFRAAVVAASLACGAAGLAIWRRRRWALRLPAWSPDLGWMLAGAALTAALVGRISLNSNFHDETGMVGHLSTTVQLASGAYPPRFLAFPALEYSYHYGFNILAATLAVTLRLRPELALDLVTVGSWFYCWCLLWNLGVVGCNDRRAGPLFASIFLVGGGFFAVCPDTYHQSGPLGAHLAPVCSESGLWLNPSLVSYFFQHPWSAGLPLFLALTVVVLGRPYSAPGPRYFAYFLLVASLMLCQMALAVLALPAVVMAEAWAAPARGGLGRAVKVGAVLAAALALMVSLGGFFAADDRASQLEFHLGIVNTDAIDRHLSWYGRSFGLLLPLGLVGLVVTRQRVFLATIVALGLVILNTVRYRLTWDIVKFATVVQTCLALLTASTLTWTLSRRQALARVGVAAALVGVLGPGLMFLGALALPVAGLPSHYGRKSTSLEEAEVRAASWLLPRVQHGCVVWVPSGREFPFAHQVPLPQVWVGDTRLFPVKKWRIDAREALINSKPSAIEPYLAQGVQFVLATDTNDLAKKAEQWEQAGTARRVWSEGKLAAYELLGARCHTR